MADRKLSILTELAATPADDDEVYIRDVSEPAADESKRITVINLLASTVLKALYDAHSLLIAVSDNTPVVLPVAASRIVGRKSTGNIVALTATELRTIINVESGATADLTGSEIVALLEALGSGSQLSHDQLDDVSTSDHHTKYTDSNARSAAVSDTVYGAGWNGVTTIAPSKNAVYDKIETLGDGGLPSATQPINSKGNDFSTVQAAINDLAGNGWVYVPAGTYNEVVTISDANVILYGAGWGTIINGGTTGHAIYVTGASCVVRDLTVKTTTGQGNDYYGIWVEGADCLILNVFVDGSDFVGISLHTSAAARGKIIGCYIYNTDSFGIYLRLGVDGLVSANEINTTREDGIFIYVDCENNVVVGNRITNWTNEAIDDDSGTSTVASNDTT